MVYIGHRHSFEHEHETILGAARHEYYWTSTSDGRENIMYDAKYEASSRVKTDYPHAVYRNRQDITQFAEQIYQQWKQKMGEPSYNRDSWNSEQGERKRLYVSAFIGKYLEELAKKDEAAKPKVQPQPQPQPAATPATPTGATITVDGATFTVRKIERSADEIVYYLEINHPGVTHGVEVLPLAHPISGSPDLSYEELASILKNGEFTN